MALEFIGFSDGAGNTSTGILSPGYPATPIEAGDLLIVAFDAVGGWNSGTDSVSVDDFTLGGVFDGANYNDFSGNYAEHIEWWYRIADGTEPGSPIVHTVHTASDFFAMTAVVRCASPEEVLANFVAVTGPGAYWHGTDPPITFTPTGERATALGMFVGFTFSSASGPVVPNPDTYPCLQDPTAGTYGNGWCSDVLAGPAAIEDAPVSFDQDLDPLSNVYARFAWLTLWIDDPELDCGTPTSAGPCQIALGSDSSLISEVDASLGSTHPGSGAATYDVFDTDGQFVEWTITLTAGEAAFANTLCDEGDQQINQLVQWFRGQMVSDGVTFQLELDINGDVMTLGPGQVPTIATAADTDPAQWFTWVPQPDATHVWVAGANVIRLTLTDLGDADHFEVAAMFFGKTPACGGCLIFEDDGSGGECSCGEVSTTEQCIRVLDFPPSGGGTGGTISGRPALLCATYGVMIIDRRNRATVMRIPEVGFDLTFGRRVDRTSDAELTVYAGEGPRGRLGVDEACCGELGKVGEWMHELVIWREGNPQEVWGGPITGVRDQLGRGVWSCTAHDRSIWFDERALPYDLIYAGNRKQDAARVFTDLVRAADQPRSYLGMSNTGGQVLPYDPIGLELFAYPTGVMVDQKVLLRADDVIVGAELRSLGDSVIDWTVVGRRMYAGALVLNLDPIPILTTDHWLEQDPEIDRQGIGVATKVVVRGAGDVRGEYPPGQVVNPRWTQYGSHFKVIKDATITDNAIATSRARTYWERWQQPNFTVISNTGTLGPKAPVTVEDLIPGRAMQIAVLDGCLPSTLRLGETRSGAGRQFFAYDSGERQPLIVPQRLFELSVDVEDSVETEVRIDTQALGTDVRTRGRINYSNAGIGEG